MAVCDQEFGNLDQKHQTEDQFRNGNQLGALGQTQHPAKTVHIVNCPLSHPVKVRNLILKAQNPPPFASWTNLCFNDREHDFR